jgi:Ice-binding-like
MIVLALTLAGFATQARASITLGTAGNFAVLSGSTVTNTGATVIRGGDVGVSPGTAITGFLAVDAGPGTITAPFTTHTGADAVAVQAHNDLIIAYNAAQALPFLPANNLSGQVLGGLAPLLPGVYHFNTSASLSGALILSSLGDPNAQFVFQIGTTLTTASNSSVTADGGSVFWQVGTSATLGTFTKFQGHILADQSITLTTGASFLGGSALAINAAVTLDTNSFVPKPTANFDDDSDVDGIDFLTWQRNFGRQSSATLAQGDANNDGKVDGQDLAVWKAQFGFVSATVTATPEPGSASLLLVCGLILAAASIRSCEARFAGAGASAFTFPRVATAEI